MLKAIRVWRQARRIRHLELAEQAFKARDFSEVYYQLGKVTRSSSRQVRRSFEIAALFKNTTSFKLLRDALKPRP